MEQFCFLCYWTIESSRISFIGFCRWGSSQYWKESGTGNNAQWVLNDTKWTCRAPWPPAREAPSAGRTCAPSCSETQMCVPLASIQMLRTNSAPTTSRSYYWSLKLWTSSRNPLLHVLPFCTMWKNCISMLVRAFPSSLFDVGALSSLLRLPLYFSKRLRVLEAAPAF